MNIDFRAYISEQLTLKGVSIYTLAKHAGLRSRITLYNYLSGKSEMTSSNLTKVIETLEQLPEQEKALR